MQIIKVPGLNNSEKNKGCRNAGNLVISEIKKIKDISMIDLEEIHVNNDNLEEQEKLIYENSKEVFEKWERVIFLGGDQSVSYSIGRAFSNVFGKNKCYLVIFDAHADCLPYKKNIQNREWLRALIEKDYFDKDKIIIIGLRNLDLEERRFIDLNKIKYYEMEKIEDFEVLCDFITESINKLNLKVYVSFDFDVIDPAFAPSTILQEPAGMSSREIIYFAKRLSKIKNIIAVDLVEIDSERDKNFGNMTVKLGAKIMGEFLN
jgi:arginase family enzyme